MATSVVSSDVSSSAEGPPRKRWTRSECALLKQSGLWDGQRFELIEGEIYNKMGKNRPHVNVAKLVRLWLERVLGVEYVDSEASIDVAPDENPSNEPEPDLIVLNRPSLEFSANPTPKDIRLVLEISDTPLRFDRKKKAPLYARAGIPEYWILDVNARNLAVHRYPAGGEYQSVKTYSEAESADSGLIAGPFSLAMMLERFVS